MTQRRPPESNLDHSVTQHVSERTQHTYTAQGSRHAETLTPPLVAVAAVIVGLLAGCSEVPVAPSPTVDSGANSAAVNFEPCTALTPLFLAQQGWDALPPSPRHHTIAGITWAGCRYVATAGYGIIVETTNATLDQIRQKFPAAAAISVATRPALRYQARPDVPGGCSINIAMGSTGSLYIMTDIPQTPRNTTIDACDVATDAADAVARLLPADR